MNLQEFTNRYQYNPSTDKLGAGGFGQVYKAYDTVLDREVALKMAQVIEGKENLSLLKEVELAKNLPVHANVAHYQDCFRLNFPNGTYDIGILQYYPEGSLATIIKNGQLSPEQSSDLTRGILEGLAFLHGHNVMHRDMKPGNVLISKRGEKYIPKIADFGLSKQVESFEKSSFVNSFAGGSAYYSAPEQLTGDKVRQNVDLWSFGVMLYELVTGDRPFTATMTKSETEDARLEIYGKIKRGDIPAKIGSVAEPYQTIIKSCLIPDRTKRVQNATDLISILDGKIPRGFDPEATVVQDNSSTGSPPPLPNEEEWPKEPFTRSSTTQVKQKPKAEKKRPSRAPEKKKRSLVLPIVLLVTSLLACAGAYYYFEVYDSKLSEQDMWIEALEGKDQASYQAVLDAYPDGQYAIQARTVVDSLESITAAKLAAQAAAWTAAEEENSIPGYENFMSAYPESDEAIIAANNVEQLEASLSDREKDKLATEKAAEDKAWQLCQGENSITSYQEYLDNYPAGRHVISAQLAIDDINSFNEQLAREKAAREAETDQWLAALQLNTIDAYQSYLDNFPNGLNRTQATDNLEVLQSNQQVTASQETSVVQVNNSEAARLMEAGYNDYIKGRYRSAIPNLEKACEQGNGEACYYLGRSYRKGQGVAKNYSKAKSYYEISMSAGFALGEYGLGALYANGSGVSKSKSKSNAIYAKLENALREKSKAGNAVFQNNYSWVLAYGLGVAKDEVAAHQWIKKAADQGFANAQNNLGSNYEYGDGVTVNYEKALEYYRKAAEQSSSFSSYNLGRMYQNGKGVPKDLVEARKWFQQAADQGNAGGQANLGKMYYLGQGGLEEDNSMALEWFRLAADKGNELAHANLGEMYLLGRAVKVDWQQAIRHYEKSLSYTGSQYRVAQFYLFGIAGKRQDKSKAMDFFRKAADNGYEKAKLALEVIPLIREGAVYSKEFGRGGMATVNAELNEPYVFNQSSGGNGWAEYVQFTMGKTQQLQIWANSFQGGREKPKDAHWNRSYNSSETFENDGGKNASIGNGTGPEKYMAYMDIGYMYINLYTERGMESLKVPMALCWPPEYVSSQR